MSLQAYVDGSGTGSELLVLAGYISTKERWAKFSEEWQKMLEAIPASDSFKMNEMAQSPVRLEKTLWFYRIIENHVQTSFSCTLKKQDVVKAARSINWPSRIYNTYVFENPYYFSFHAIVNVLLQHKKPLEISEPVDFIFDRESEGGVLLENWNLIKESVSSDVCELMGSLSYQDDKKVLPLQAADLFAWWIRKFEMEKISWTEGPPYPWDKKKNIPGIHIEFAESDIRAHWVKALKNPEVMERAACWTTHDRL